MWETYEVCEKSTRKVSLTGVILYLEICRVYVSCSTARDEQRLLGSADWATQLRPARRAGPGIVTAIPRHTQMSEIRNFVARLTMAGKSFKEIKETTDAAYGDMTLQKTQYYSIIK